MKQPPRTAVYLALHLAAVFTLGCMAGFFGTYSANVALALREFDGPTYALVQSALNRNVRHTLFFAFFFLPPLLAAGAAAAGWRLLGTGRLLLLGAALLYAGGIVFFTREVNLPLNAYTESWNPQALPADWALTRERWNAANLWRAVASAAAFGLALAALGLPRARQACATAPQSGRILPETPHAA